MKKCHRFHAEDVEVGDVLELVYDDIPTTITVRGKGLLDQEKQEISQTH